MRQKRVRQAMWSLFFGALSLAGTVPRNFTAGSHPPKFVSRCPPALPRAHGYEPFSPPCVHRWMPMAVDPFPGYPVVRRVPRIPAKSAALPPTPYRAVDQILPSSPFKETSIPYVTGLSAELQPHVEANLGGTLYRSPL